METVVHGLAANNYVVGLANLGGIIALLVLLYGVGRWAYGFGKTAYQKNIRAAIYRARRRNFLKAKRAALDLHTFISIIVVDCLMVLLASLMTIISLVSWSTRYTVPPAERLSGALHVSQSWDTIAFDVLLFAPQALLMFLIFRLARFAWRTRLIRTKLVIRKWRRTHGASSDPA